MNGSQGQDKICRSFFCLFCKIPNAFPVNDIQRFNEHMQGGHHVADDSKFLLAQHFTSPKENKEIIDRVTNEISQYFNASNQEKETKKKKLLSGKVEKHRYCLFCEDGICQKTFKEHLIIVHNIFFGHDLFLATKLLTVSEKDMVVKRVQNKAVNNDNNETIWKFENVSCQYCFKRFKSSERLTWHMEKERCSDCQKCFSTSDQLRRHISIDTKYSRCLRLKFCCQVCKKVFGKEILLKKHERKHEEKIKVVLECNDCHKVFTSNQILAIHQKRRRKCTVKNFQCQHCDETFSLTEKFKKHKHYHKRQKSTKCNNCLNEMEEYKYNQHLKSCQAFYSLYNMMCETCFKCFDNVTKFRYHISLLHNDGGPFKCDLCAKTCATNVLLKKHVKFHYFEFECKQCPTKFASKKSLKYHTDIHLGEKFFECNRCLKKFALRRSLISHAKRHHPLQVNEIIKIKRPPKVDDAVMALMELSETGWKCVKCGKGDKTQSILKGHIERVHLKRRPFACTKCDRSFAMKQSYDAHCRWHAGEKNFVCETCQRAFLRKFALDRHKNMHFQVLSYPCSKCDKAFVSSSGLRYHVKSKHLKEKHPCLQCPKSLTSSTSLKFHVNKIHKAKEKEEKLLQLYFSM